MKLYDRLDKMIDYKTGSGLKKVMAIVEEQVLKSSNTFLSGEAIDAAEKVFDNLESPIWKKRCSNFINYLYYKKRYLK